MATKAAATTTPPAIGAEWQGGIYAGLTIHDNKPMHLVVLPGDTEATWAKAGAWAKKQGGELPSRVDALILFQNVRPEFKRDAYWTAQPYAGDESFAWCQGFYGGTQGYGHKSYALRARAVRRFPI